MSIQDEKVRRVAGEYIYNYVTGGDYVRDQRRFGKMANFIQQSFPGTKRVASVGCGSAEESIAFATTGFDYNGYDISGAYANRFPLDITSDIRTEGTGLNKWFKGQYQRYDDIGDELNALANPASEIRERVKMNIGEEFDATKPEFWQKIDADEGNLVLLRHPDIKDNYEVTSTILKSSLEIKAPVMISTSNTMSLALILSMMDKYLSSQAVKSTKEELDEGTQKGLLQFHRDFKERIGDIVPQVLNTLHIKGVTDKPMLRSSANIFETGMPVGKQLEEPITYLSVFGNWANRTFELKDGTVLKVKTKYTPEFSRNEFERNLDSWVVTVEKD